MNTQICMIFKETPRTLARFDRLV